MTRLAFAGRWVGWASNLGFSNEPSAAVPMPAAMRPKKWRRVMNRLWSMRLAFRQKFVEVHDHTGDGGPGGELGFVRAAGRAEFFRGGRIVLEFGELLVEGVQQDFGFVGLGRAAGGEAESVGEAFFGVAGHDALGEAAGRIDEMRIVEGDERLQWGVGEIGRASCRERV